MPLAPPTAAQIAGHGAESRARDLLERSGLRFVAALLVYLVHALLRAEDL